MPGYGLRGAGGGWRVAEKEKASRKVHHGEKEELARLNKTRGNIGSLEERISEIYIDVLVNEFWYFLCSPFRGGYGILVP